jgi:hypothetical protein
VPVKAAKNKEYNLRRLPARIIDKGLASDRVVIDTVVSKSSLLRTFWIFSRSGSEPMFGVWRVP